MLDAPKVALSHGARRTRLTLRCWISHAKGFPSDEVPSLTPIEDCLPSLPVVRIVRIDREPEIWTSLTSRCFLDLKYNRWRWDIPDVGCACARWKAVQHKRQE